MSPTVRPRIRHGIYLAPFDHLADPHVLGDVAVAAEDAGWDGLFLWDHVLRPEPTRDIADPWICMAAIALRTERLVTGPLVTPLIRRRLSTLARQTVTLDHLARGRFVFGVGLGVDSGRELSAFGEETDARLRGDITDEAIVALQGLWSGEPTTVHGEHVFVDDVVYLPRPYQQPRIPTWFAARGDAVRPARRAGRFGDGIYPIEVDRSQLARMLDVVRAERGGTLAGFTVALREMDGPEGLLDLAGDADTIWVLRDLWPDITIADTLDEIATPY